MKTLRDATVVITGGAAECGKLRVEAVAVTADVGNAREMAAAARTAAGLSTGTSVVLVAFMAALATGGGSAFRVVGEVVRVVLFPAADRLLRHALLAFH